MSVDYSNLFGGKATSAESKKKQAAPKDNSIPTNDDFRIPDIPTGIPEEDSSTEDSSINSEKSSDEVNHDSSRIESEVHLSTSELWEEESETGTQTEEIDMQKAQNSELEPDSSGEEGSTLKNGNSPVGNSEPSGDSAKPGSGGTDSEPASSDSDTKEVEDNPFSSMDFSTIGMGKREVSDLKPDNSGDYDLISDEGSELPDNLAEEKYEELNRDMIGEQIIIRDGYPKFIVGLRPGETLTHRELMSIKHFVIKENLDEEEVSKRKLIRFQLEFSINGNPRKEILGYIAPESIGLFYEVLKERRLEAYYKEDKFLTGVNILALSSSQVS